jgi:hypothetical protein
MDVHVDKLDANSAEQYGVRFRNAIVLLCSSVYAVSRRADTCATEQRLSDIPSGRKY